MAILKRPMFRKGGSANEGIMHGLERRGYADSNWEDIAKAYGATGIGDRDDMFKFDWSTVDEPPMGTGDEGSDWIPDWYARQDPKYKHFKEYVTETGGVPEGRVGPIAPGEKGGPGYIEPATVIKKDDGGIDGISGADAKTIIADKKSMLSDRAKEFAELLSPGAQKRAIYDALGAASAAFGKSTGNTKQDIANAISAAAAASGGARDTFEKARLLAIEEDIKKGIAEAGKADYKPNATQSLINYLEDSGMTKEEVAAHLTSKSAKDELDYVRAYSTTPEAIGAFVSDVESKDIKNFGGVLSNNPKERKDELKTLPEGQIYFDSAKNEYVTITKDAEGDREFKFLKKR